MDKAYDMLSGEIIIFSVSGVLFSTSLKMSKANEFSDSIKEACFRVRFIGTGLSGKLSDVFSHENRKRVTIKE
jgi:hypothetical protein